MFLTNLSLKRPVFATVVIIALLAVGALCFTKLAVNSYPDVSAPYVMVSVTYAGASPDAVETKVTKKIEDAVAQISMVKHITSRISEGYSMSFIEFDYSKSPDTAMEEVKEKLSAIRATLPDEMSDPVIRRLEMDSQPILSLVVTGPMSKGELTKIVDDTIIKKLDTVNGVGSITASGEEEREIRVKLDNNKLNSYGLTTAAVISSLQSDNVDVPTGKIDSGSSQLSLRTNSSIKNVDDFLNVLVKNKNGTEIRIRDVANVEDTIADMTSLAYYQGNDTIGIDIVKQSGVNTTQVAKDLKAQISSIQKTLPKGVNINIVKDNSISIENSVNDVINTLIQGCLLAIIIIFLFLGQLSSTGISAISLPTSIITTFAVMKLFNFSLNTMSLMGLSLAVGLLVDDAIVVIENITRHMQMGASPIQAAKEGTKEIGLAVMATTFTIVAVFLPVTMVSGMIGGYFKEFGITIAASVLISLFVSFTLVPLLSSKLQINSHIRGPIGKFIDWFNNIFKNFSGFYSKVLKVALEHRILTLIIAFAMFFGSLALIPTIGMSFMSVSDTGELQITATTDGGSTLDSASKTTKQMENVIKQNPEVKFTYSTVKANSISIYVKLTDKTERTAGVTEIAANIRNELMKVPGISVKISAGASQMSGQDATFIFLGDNFDQLYNYALSAEKILKTVKGAVDVNMDYTSGTQETRIEVDRDKAADLGVSPATVASVLYTMYNGTTATYFEQGNNRYNVKVMLNDDMKKNVNSLNEIYVQSSTGQMISLDQVTKKVFSTSASSITRYDKSRRIQLGANILGPSTTEFNQEFMAKLKSQTVMPSSVRQTAGSMTETMNKSVADLTSALMMGILFIFLILCAQFESFIDPLSILFALPFAIIGALLGLFFTNNPITMTTLIAMIMLMGIVTKNAILLIDFTKQKRSQGVERKEAILEAGLIRIRPIVMTTLAMVFGMLPSALSTGSNSSTQGPMSIAIIGGLITSTLLTLVVVPVIYTYLDDFRNFVTRPRKKKSKVKKEKTESVEAEAVTNI